MAVYGVVTTHNGTATGDSELHPVALPPMTGSARRAGAQPRRLSPFIEAGNVLVPSRAVALFDPEGLIEEASSFPSGAHDDLVDATSQALAAMMIDSSGAAAWIAWARRKALEARGIADDPDETADVPAPARRPAIATAPAPPEPAAADETPLEGTVLDPVAARKRARDEAFRASPEAAMMRAFSSSG